MPSCHQAAGWRHWAHKPRTLEELPTPVLPHQHCWAQLHRKRLQPLACAHKRTPPGWFRRTWLWYSRRGMSNLSRAQNRDRSLDCSKGDRKHKVQQRARRLREIQKRGTGVSHSLGWHARWLACAQNRGHAPKGGRQRAKASNCMPGPAQRLFQERKRKGSAGPMRRSYGGDRPTRRCSLDTEACSHRCAPLPKNLVKNPHAAAAAPACMCKRNPQPNITKTNIRILLHSCGQHHSTCLP